MSMNFESVIQNFVVIWEQQEINVPLMRKMNKADKQINTQSTFWAAVQANPSPNDNP